MNKNILLIIGIFVFISLATAFTTNNIYSYGNQIMENYTSGEDDSYFLYGAQWRGQSFRVGITGENRNFTLTKIELKMRKSGTVDGYRFIVSIRNTSSGLPVGKDLSTGFIYTSDIGTSDAWYNISMSPVELNTSKLYSIVIRLDGGSAGNEILFRVDGTSATYPDGTFQASTDSGASWIADSGTDIMFRVYGENTTEYNNYLGENLSIGEWFNRTRFIRIPTSVLFLTNSYLTFQGKILNTTYNQTVGDSVNIAGCSGCNVGQNFTAESNIINKICLYVRNDSANQRANISLRSTSNGADLAIKTVMLNSTGDTPTCADIDYTSTIGNLYWVVISNVTNTSGSTVRPFSVWYTADNFDGYGSFSYSTGTYTYLDRIYKYIVNYNTSYPFNSNVILGNSVIFNTPKQYSTINTTTNQASYLNSIMSSYQVGSYYYIPLIFNSSTNSFFEYSNFTITNDGFLENSQTYDSTGYVGSASTFLINITYDTNFYSSATAYFVYNNSIYSSSSTTSGTNQLFSRTITLPTIESTNPFYWILNLTNSSGTTSFTSNNYTQAVSYIQFKLCNQSFNVSFINFTTYDAESRKLINATFKASFNFGINSVGLNASYQDLTERNSSWTFCINPPDRNYNISANIEYDSTDYAINYYYLDGAGFSNQTTNIPLYLLNSSKATLTVLQTKDLSKIPITDIIIQIQAYDTGTDTYKTVSMAKSDYKGEDISYLNWYDTFYKFILIKNGQVLLITNSSKISSTPKEFLIGENLIYDYDKFNNVIYTLTYNNITSNFVLTYSDPSGQISSNCLRVIKRNILNDTIICNTCETSSSATIYCNIASYGNGTYLATYYGIGSLYGFDTIEQIIGLGNSLFEEIGISDGIIYAIILTLTVVGITLVSPVFAIVAVILGVIGSLALGFLPTEQFLLPTIGLVIVGGILIWLIKR